MLHRSLFKFKRCSSQREARRVHPQSK